VRNLSDFTLGTGTAVDVAAQGAQEYARSMGLVRPNRFDNVVVNPVQKQIVAHDFMAAPEFDPAAVPHFRAMADETKRQFDFMTSPRSKGGLGIDFEVSDEDPYKKLSVSGTHEVPDPAAMMRDIRENNRIRVLSTATTGAHPYFTNDENDMFRGVHDFFGHAATGRAFDESGEDAAYLSHAAMFSPRARLAMATETRGQNMTNNSGIIPKNADGSPGYAPNKIAIIPSTQLILPFGRRAIFRQQVERAQRAHERAFGPINE
jgi:hypothetical protein